MRVVSWRSSITNAVVHDCGFEQKAVGVSVIAAHMHDLGHLAMTIDTRDVDDNVNCERDRLADTPVWQSDVGGEHAVRESRECLFGRVRVNRAQTAEVPCVECL